MPPSKSPGKPGQRLRKALVPEEEQAVPHPSLLTLMIFCQPGICGLGRPLGTRASAKFHPFQHVN